MHPNTTRRQTKTHKALIYTHDLQMHMRNAIVAEPLMQQLCSQKQGPREAAMVVYALVRPAFMRLMKHDPLTLLDEFILPPPPLPIPSLRCHSRVSENFATVPVFKHYAL